MKKITLLHVLSAKLHPIGRWRLGFRRIGYWRLGSWFLTLVIGLLVIGYSVGLTWSNPTENPPGGNLPAPINVGGTTQTKTGGLNIATVSGNVGIGTTGPNHKLEIHGGDSDLVYLSSGNVGLELRSSAASPSIYIDFTKGSTSTAGTGNPDYTSRIRFDGMNNDLYFEGFRNVGIGTTNPAYKLDVVGDIRATGNVYGAFSGAVSAGNVTPGTFNSLQGGGGNYTFPANLTVDTNTLFVDATNDRVGIGTTGPNAPLSIGAYFQGDTTLLNGIYIGNRGYDQWNRILVSDWDSNADVAAVLSTYFNSSNLFGILSLGTRGYGGVENTLNIKQGNVGIGTTGPGARLDITRTGATQCCASQTPTLSLNETGSNTYPWLQFHSSGFQEAFIRLASSSRVLEIGDSQSIGTRLALRNAANSANNILLNPVGDTYFNGGNVGIGTTEPTQRLTIAGQAFSTGSFTGTFIPGAGGLPGQGFGMSDDSDAGGIMLRNYGVDRKDLVIWWSDNTNDMLRFQSALWDGTNQVLNDRMVIGADGNVGIGTTNPGSNKLEVAGGPIKATGGLIIETRTSDPASPVAGQIWLRTDL